MVCLNFKLSVPRSSVLTTKVTLEKNVFFRALPIYFYKLLTDIIASKYLSMCVQVKRASDLWKETNSQALDRLARLRGVFAIQHHEDVNLIVFFFSQTTKLPGRGMSRSVTSFSRNLMARTPSSRISIR